MNDSNKLVMEKGKVDLLRTPPAMGELPWLMCTHGNSKRKQVQSFYSAVSPSLSIPKAYLKSIPQLRGKNILHSHQGWLVLQDRNQLGNLCVLNLVTSQVIDLPPLPVAPGHGQGLLFALALSPDCDACTLLLCFYKDDGYFVFCRPSHLHCSWVTQTFEFEGEVVSICQLVALNGVIYGITAYRLIVICTEDDDSKSLIFKPLEILDPVVDIYAPCDVTWLVESCNSVYLVRLYCGLFELPRILCVKVFELDLHEKIWVEVKCLNGRAFFLSKSGGGCSAWCWGTTQSLDSPPIGGVEGNCIYLHMPCTSESLLLYNLLDQTWKTLLPCPRLVSPCDTLFWVVPPQPPRLLACGAGSTESIEKEDFPRQSSVCAIECQELSQHNVSQEGILSKLPFHIIELISDRMHLFEYWNFRASCKILRSRLSEPQHKTNNVPLFMILKDRDGLCTIMDPCRHESRSKNILPLLLDPLTIEFSKNGWLLYSVGTKSLQFVNVLTREMGDFPPFPDMGEHTRYKSVAFSTYPTSSECVTIAIYYYQYEISFCYLQSGDETWNIYDFYHEDIEFCPSSSSPIFLKGAFYFLDMSGHLGEFALVDGCASWQVYDKPEIRDEEYCLSSLVDCDGEIYSVFVGNMGNWIQVFWFDFSKQHCWVEVDHLNNHIFCISLKSYFSMFTRDLGMRNKICLPWLRGKGIVCYSTDTKKYQVLGRDDVLENLYGLKEPSFCCWI